MEVLEQPFVTIKEIAKLVKVSPKTVYWWISQGKLPHVYQIAGSTIRFRSDDIRAWLNDAKKLSVENVKKAGD